MDKPRFPPKQDDDQESYGLGDSKRPRMDNDGDEIGMFFALVDRIRATNEILKQRSATFDPAESTPTAAENIEAKILTDKSPWKLSFESEDFSYGGMMFGSNCSSSNVRDSANNSPSASNGIQKPGTRSDKGGKVWSSDKHRPVRSFDLNIAAPSEHPFP